MDQRTYLELEISKTRGSIEFYKRCSGRDVEKCLKYEENLLAEQKKMLETLVNYEQACHEVFGNNGESLHSEDSDVNLIEESV